MKPTPLQRLRSALNCALLWFEQVDGLAPPSPSAIAKGNRKSSYSGDKYVDLGVSASEAIVGVAWDDRRNATAPPDGDLVKGNGRPPPAKLQRQPGSAITDASFAAYMRAEATACWTGPRTGGWRKTCASMAGSITDRKYWDYLSSLQYQRPARDANDKALAVMPRPHLAAGRQRRRCPNNNAPAPGPPAGIFIVEKDMIMPNAHPDLWQRCREPPAASDTCGITHRYLAAEMGSTKPQS